ncbi:MAG: hypothetical protein LBT44_07715, partial [Clostridiales bacterium]|nr:hypothetical protein [Clostridiales bacterium]
LSQPYVYFDHAYCLQTDAETIVSTNLETNAETIVSATCEYGGTLRVAVQKGRLFGVQFHPEKSGAVGLGMLARFGGLL